MLWYNWIINVKIGEIIVEGSLIIKSKAFVFEVIRVCGGSLSSKCEGADEYNEGVNLLRGPL